YGPRHFADRSLALGKWRDALLVPEVVVGVDLSLGHGESLVVTPEVFLSPDHACLVAADVADDDVLAEVQVPVVEVGLPRVGAHVRRHERVEVPDPLGLHGPVTPGHGPEVHVLDVVQHAGAVREGRRRLRHGGGLRAVGVQDHEPRVGLRELGEDGGPHVPGDGLPDVVGRGLVAAAEDGGGEAAVEPQLREAAAHHRQQRVAGAEEQGLEVGRLLLDEHPDEEVVGEGRRDLLPSRHDVHGALAGGHGEVEHRDRGRHGHEPHLPRQHDAEALAAAAADGPEHVAAHGGLAQEPPPGVHQHGVQDVVDGQAVLAQQHAEAAAAEMAPDADGWAQAGREPQHVAGLPDGVVELAKRGAGVHPRRRRLRVHAHGAEVGQVEHREDLGVLGPVGQALVVVAAAAHADAHAVPAAAEHGRLHVGRVRRRDDVERAHDAGREKFGVSDGGLEQRRERRRALREHELAGDPARREALEEAIGGGSLGRRDGGVGAQQREDYHEHRQP
ncbi:hypothetical protein U9M48_027390, partial [Paspalum notatum var. saurae]